MKNSYKKITISVGCLFVVASQGILASEGDDNYDLIYGPVPSAKKTPSYTFEKQQPAKENWFLNFDDLVGTERSNNLDPERGRTREMLKTSTSKTKSYIKSDARRHLASSTKIRAALATLGAPVIWTNGNGLSQKGEDLLRFIRQSDAHGLWPADYQVDQFTAGLPSEKLEAVASKAYVRLANDILLGRLNVAKADYDWHIKQSADVRPVSALLGEAVQSHNIFGLLESKLPDHAMYAGLTKALQRLKAQQGSWAPFPAAGPRLQLGVSHPHVGLLRARLGLGFGGSTMDQTLKSALQVFQSEHGLNSDGVVGRRTRVALSTGVSRRIVQLEQSLERLRWLPNHLPEKYVFVNTAGYELNLREDDRTVLKMRTVVGQKRRGGKNHETPSFSKNMKYVVLNPKWHVPASILSKEFLPKAQKDPGFFARENYTVYSSTGAKVNPRSVNWQQYVKGEKIPFSVVQGEGNSNALGRIKFMLPNKYSIYLHDTPSKSLFKKERRSFSHGCVRLADPVQLATTLLGKSRQDVKNLIGSNKNQKIYLKQQVPVFIAYITAWARDDGTVVFFDDYYGHDNRMRHNFQG